MVLYSAVSSPLDRSKRFTLSSPGRPVHSDTVLGFSWKQVAVHPRDRPWPRPVLQRSFCHMTGARVDNTPCRKTGEFSLDSSEMSPVNVVTSLMCNLKRPLRYGGYICNQIQQNNVEMC